MDDDSVIYTLISIIIWFISFLGIWFEIGTTYGVWGVIFGWLPAAILGAIIGFLWPLWVLIAVGLWVYLKVLA
jgi:hypothetical protein